MDGWFDHLFLSRLQFALTTGFHILWPLLSIGPVWHASQTWLVVLAGLWFGAFPLAYGLVLSALYIPLMLMLFGLIPRAVTLEFREEAAAKRPWSLVVAGGSLLAALALLLPVMLIYNGYQHLVFRGKTREGGYGYGE